MMFALNDYKTTRDLRFSIRDVFSDMDRDEGFRVVKKEELFQLSHVFSDMDS